MEKNQEQSKMVNGVFYLLNPSDNQYYPVEDQSEKFSTLNKNAVKSQEEAEFEREFEKRRTLKRMGNGSSDEEGPVPGGVGYGSFYTDEYKSRYQTGTVIAVDIICPQYAGGNVDTWLYLTETNRTAKGVEALIYYLGASVLGFKVFDWARDDHWQVTLSAHELADYLTTKTIQGSNRQVLSLQNQTFIVNTSQGKRWRNQVFLFNYKNNSYSLVYAYEYEATEMEQKAEWVGAWGPIVETFQDSYQNTNPLGFSYTYMQERDAMDTWTPFHLLTNDISYIRNDGKGFQNEFLLPNHSFAVH